MSYKQQGEGLGDAILEEHKASPASRNRQPNSTGGEGEGVPVRRSWRPCQMLGQDGQEHHHHHHPPIPHQGTGRGPARHRRQTPSGQGPSRQWEGADMEPPRHTQPPRPGVARYRRQGEPRVRVHRQRPPPRDGQDTHALPFQQQRSSGAPLTEQRDMTGPATMKQQHPPHSCPPHHTQNSRAPDLTAGTSPTPTHHTPCPTAPDPPSQDLHQTLPNIESPQPQEEEEEGYSSSITQSVSTQSGFDNQTDLENQREGGHGEGELKETGLGEEDRSKRDLVEDDQEDGTNEYCSDTESAASLSMEAPPLRSPPHQSPFLPPPVQSENSDQCSDEFSPSPTYENDIMPDDDSYTDSPLSHPKSFTFRDSYPKTYAEFYNESYPQSESITESNTEPYAKSYPQSFPAPLKLINYPDRRSEADPDEPYSEPHPGPCSRRQSEHVYKRATDTEPQPRDSWPGRDVGLPQTSPHWQGRSVGSRLHHYNDTTSDGEDDSLKESPRSQSLGPPPWNVQGEAQSEQPSSGQPGSGEFQDEQAGIELRPPAEGLSEDSVTGSGDAISLAIRDIREAIEEVKTKTVRSPYTPDQPIEPVWVMRPEVSPNEVESSPEQPPGGDPVSQSPSHYNPAPSRVPSRVPSPVHVPVPAPAPSRVPSRVPVPVPEHVCPVRVESSRTHQVQQREHREQREPPRPPSIEEIQRHMPSFPTYVEVPGPCDPEDLIDGIIFAASYLGSTHLLSERTPTKSARMQQAQEAMSRVRTAQKQAKNRKKTGGEIPSSTEVDLFMSTQRIKVLNADTQASMMDLPLRTISYIADIGNMVVLMARGKMVRSRSAQEHLNHTTDHTNSPARDDLPQYRMVCHVFESEDAQLIAQSIGQAFSVAYQEFLRANGIDPEDLSQREYSDLLNTQDMYNDDLIHFSKSENCRDVYIEKQKGEMLGVVIVESGWGSILPTVIIASMMHFGPAEKSGRLNIGDQIMTINGTSLVGLPLSTCQSIIKICSLMRGGIAERGGVRVGHRIIDINGQSVVATPHEKIVQVLSNAVGEIHMKTMPAAMYRLLTAQEQPVYI
uniref:Amyloid beta (A4) precursor protein-binding, family A, member 1b n=1 Tax=Oncorhynchus kisutch TaxID=8019 RepID=A0A8C7LJV7_ONCKI